MSSHVPSQQTDRDALFPPARATRDGRSASAVSALSRTPGLFSGTFHAQPGSFNPDVKSTIIARGEIGRPGTPNFVSFQSQRRERQEDAESTERRQAEIKDKIEKEMKIKVGSENLLEALNSKNAKQTRDQRLRVESELNAANRKIVQLKLDLAAEIEKSREPSPSRLSQLFRSAPVRSPTQHEDDDPFETTETESPTYVLTELLQDLEAEGHASDYYVERANSLADLFKRTPTLKYDLVWSIFGLRMQSLLLSDSREVVAAGYRVLRHVISDRKSLSIIRSLQTDYLVILSLVKASKASLEREQALKFVRAFLDVKDGTKELSRGVVRVVAAVSQHSDDQLRSISVLTLAELLIRDPALAVSAGAVGILTDAFARREYQSSEGLINAFLFLADTPARRMYMTSGYELDSPFVSFTDGTFSASEETLRTNAGSIATLLKSWPGLFLLSRNNFSSIRSLLLSLHLSSPLVRDVVLELLFDVLRIKNPSWSSSFLAGRRLTTYGRVGTWAAQPNQQQAGERKAGDALVNHFTAALLSALVHANLLQTLLHTIQNEADGSIKRKATLLLGEVLNVAHNLLPSDWSLRMQVLPTLFQAASVLEAEERHVASSAIYQIDSVNRTLLRTANGSSAASGSAGATPRQLRTLSDLTRTELTPQMDENHFRAAINETGVLSTVNFTKWRWDIIQKLIDGPLLNPKRLEEATKASKFVKRIMGFYRPFKYRFSEMRNTQPNQRYVRIGCSLIRTLLANPEGVRYLAEHKLLRQVAECLAQVDRLSGLTSMSPLFSADRLSDTLCGGYFAMLGTMSGSVDGLVMFEKRRIFNMFYHIVELKDRDDLIKALLGSMDYTLDSHLRVIISKAMTSCSLEIRTFATRLLRKYATQPMQLNSLESVGSPAQWAIRLLVTQLYDPEIEVCEFAIRILEEVCNTEESLEFVVRCRPALDHLGEIGAPLLLRFLSTSSGYHYLDGLDYISQEMDDWFLGRNDSYVTLVEASLSKWAVGTEASTHPEQDDAAELSVSGAAPPHFYRELARTAEGCQLLRQKDHFSEFVAIIRDHGLETEDTEMMTKAKGAMWAVGNVGSMELGAPFLESSDVVELILRVAEGSQVLSMRGTAFFVLGLISRSIHGQEMLAEHGWDSTVDETGHSTGICLPMDFPKLFALPCQVKDTEAVMTEEDATSRESIRAALKDDDATNQEILALVNDLNNGVLVEGRAGELHALKAKKAPGFQQPQLFHKVMRILEQHHFRLPVLRFVIDLFGKRVLRQIVLEEESDDEDFESTIVAPGLKA